MKVGDWLKGHKKQIGQLILALVLGIIVSGIFLLVFYFTGVFYWDNGFKFNIELLNGLRNSVWLYFAFVGIMAISGTLLCMNPVGSGVFVWLGIALFGANWKCFIATLGGCLLSYIFIDALGRIGGSKLIIKIFGGQEYNNTKDLINEKGIVYVPIMYLLPIFPDDFICLCVGSMKMKWWLHMLYALIGKSVGIATVVFGVSIIPKDLFLPISIDKLYNYFVLIACLIVYITTLFKGARWLDKKLSKLIERKRYEKEKAQKVVYSESETNTTETK